jgi:CMP-N,N'-diacetyllegionaminic acid synthase
LIWDPGVSLCLIPARGGSTGVPRKNLRPLGGLPLVAHSIRSARASGLFDRVHVSTDDPAISEIAAAYGAVAIERPAEIAQADTPMPPVIEHALTWCERERGERPRYLFLLQPTSPLRSAEDICRAASLLGDSGCDSVMGVFEADDPPQWALSAAADGSLHPVSGWDQYLSRRQDLPRRYFDGPVYAIETASYLAAKRFLTQRTRFFVMPRTRSIDIDTEFDFLLAELLLAHDRDVTARGPQPSTMRAAAAR